MPIARRTGNNPATSVTANPTSNVPGKPHAAGVIVASKTFRPMATASASPAR
ncbi:MAG: hypothetical protein HW378_3369, partial [Anaerolineales bacterium]|nr:hypothetical protein [Anaerolineales bacterium]